MKTVREGRHDPQTENCRCLDSAHHSTSAYTTKRYPPGLVSYMKTNGRKKVLFGSNYPIIQPDNCLENLAYLELDDETRDLFLFGNTVRVFELDAAA